MSLSNEYEKILKYLEDQKSDKKKDLPVKKKLKKKKTIIEEFKDLPTVQHYNKKNISIKSNFFDVNNFEDLMRKKLIKDHETYQNYERPYISVSELYNCLRKNYYTRKKYKVDLRKQYNFSYLYLIQKIGNAIHDVLQELYNFDECEKTVLSEKYKVKGRVDSIKDSTIYEIKSIDPSKFKGNYIEEHKLQGMIYAYLLNTEYNYNIKNITIIYVLRTLKKIFPIDIKVDMKIGEKYVTRAPLLIDALNKNEIIDPIGATAEQCKWCPFKNKFCDKEIKTNIKIKQKEKIKTGTKSQFLL